MADKWKWSAVWAVLAGFFCLSLWDFYTAFILVGNPASFISKRLIIFLCTLPFLASFWGYWLWTVQSNHFPAAFFDGLISRLRGVKLLLRGLAAGLLLIMPVYLLLYSPLGDFHAGYWFRLGLLCMFAAGATFILFPAKPDLTWLVKLAGMIMTAGAIFTTADWFNDVVSYPFSLDWSEGNRMWDYSMLFGSARYINPDGQPFFTFIEPGRQFLWGLPFIVPNLTIFGYRLWNALVWILPPIILSICCILEWPFTGKKWIWQAGFVIWGYMFLSQGPIYSPLLLAAAMIAVATRQRHIWLGALLVMLATYFCYVSRWTWMYAPGLWAGLLAFLNATPPFFSKGNWKKLIRPFVYGISGYISAQYIPLLINQIERSVVSQGNNISALTLPNMGRFTLIWDRLLPNPTYPPGILLGALWVGLPAVLLVYGIWRLKIWKPDWMQLLALILVPGLFLGIGMVASVKIGGGNNLHNLDMFWVTLIFVVGFFVKKWMDSGLPGPLAQKALAPYLAAALLLPVSMMIQYGEPLRLPPQDMTDSTLAAIQTEVNTARAEGEVLFIDQRQLITFGYIQNMPMIDDYEKKYLMDQAISKKTSYLEQFGKDLAAKRFALIVTEPISQKLADEGLKNFAEENNAWVESVSLPIIENYKPVLTNERIGVQLLVPRK